MWKSLKSSKFAASVGALLAASLVSGAAGAQDVTFGKDIPLGVAASQIVPGDYKVAIGKGVDRGASVSWGAEDSWRKAIEKAARSGGYTVSYAGKTVRISGPAEAGPVAAGAAAGAESAAAPVLEARAAPAPRAAARPRRIAHRPVHAQPRHVARHEVAEPAGVREEHGASVPASGFVLLGATRSESARSSAGEWRKVDSAARAAPTPAAPAAFDAVAGRSLSAVLEEWGAREGWRVEWKTSYEYKLTSSARFGGDFVAAASELVRTMSKLRPEPTVTFYKGNKVAVVGNGGPDEAAN